MKRTVLFRTLYRIFFAITILSMASCESDPEPQDSTDDEEQNDIYMVWESDVELNTETMFPYKREHKIYYPLTDCSFKIKCKNYRNLKFGSTHVVGYGCLNDNCWHSNPSDKSEWTITDHCYSSPYYKIEIEDNELRISLKGGSTDRTPCHMVVCVEVDDEHGDLFYIEPETERPL